MEDNPPPMNVIESWYSSIMESIDKTSDALTNFLRDYASDKLTGTEWKLCAQQAATKVRKAKQFCTRINFVMKYPPWNSEPKVQSLTSSSR